MWHIFISGFLAFREVPSCLNLFKKLKRHHPEMVPQVLLFDGNGILHPQGMGLASHFGVVADVCTIGVAKSLHLLNHAIEDKKHLSEIGSLKQPGDYFTLQDENGFEIGAVRIASFSFTSLILHYNSLLNRPWKLARLPNVQSMFQSAIVLV